MTAKKLLLPWKPTVIAFVYKQANDAKDVDHRPENPGLKRVTPQPSVHLQTPKHTHAHLIVSINKTSEDGLLEIKEGPGAARARHAAASVLSPELRR